MDTQTMEHKQLLGIDSELEKQCKSRSLRNPNSNYKNRPKKETTSRRALTWTKDEAQTESELKTQRNPNRECGCGSKHQVEEI